LTRLAAAAWAAAQAFVLHAGTAPPAAAVDVWRDGERYLQASGSIRELFQATRGTDASDFENALVENGCLVDPDVFADCPAFDLIGEQSVWESKTRFYAQLDAGIGDGITGQLIYEFEWRVGVLDTLFAAPGAVEDTFLGLEHQVGGATGSHAQVQRVYRGWLRYERGPLLLTVGRQRIPWGVGRLWNPIDRFNAIGPLQIESDQSLGIDSVDARWSFSGFDQLQLVYAPGTSRADARYAARYQAVIRDTDVGLMVGRFEEAFATGFDLAGNLGDSAWRVEAVWTDPSRPVLQLGLEEGRELDPFWQIVASIDHNFDVGTGIYALVEHLWNQNALGLPKGKGGGLLPFFRAPGLPASSDVFGASGVISLVSHQTGFLTGYDLTSALRGQLLVIWDWRGESAAIVPSLTFTGWNAVELTLGAQLFTGGDRSQYGQQEPVGYVLVEWFF
jgi:hypothetical protein